MAFRLSRSSVEPNGGVVQQVGSPIELYQRPANLFVAGFIGSPKMNFVPVQVDRIEGSRITVSGQDVINLTFEADASAVKPGDKLTLGVRPHDLTPASSGSIVGRVGLVERLGNETIVSLELPSGSSWLAVLDGDQPLNRGESIALSADTNKAILFDVNGNSLIPKAPG